MRTYRKICDICCCEFVAAAPSAKYCSSCRSTAIYISHNIWNTTRRRHRKGFRGTRSGEHASIAEICRRAKERGWSYGKQVAYEMGVLK